jgi:hypothetical protein
MRTDLGLAFIVVAGLVTLGVGVAFAQPDPPPPPCTECLTVDGGGCTKAFTMTEGQECFCERGGQPIDGLACRVPPTPPPPPAQPLHVPNKPINKFPNGALTRLPQACETCYYRMPGLTTALSCQVASGKTGDACACSVTSPRKVVPLIFRGKMCVEPPP